MASSGPNPRRNLAPVEQRIPDWESLSDVHTNSAKAFSAPHLADDPGVRRQNGADAHSAVTSLYRAHALSLTRLAHVMLGQRSAAEDVVQEAFCNLYLRWGKLADPETALPYLRASVLNGCRTAVRRARSRDHHATSAAPDPVSSAELAVLASEEHRTVMTAIRSLPARQREVLLLRFYLGEPEAEIARIMGIKQSTVRSTGHRALAALGRQLGVTR
jgi:RNA polymerase sigma-70 factor (sigma-E family)